LTFQECFVWMNISRAEPYDLIDSDAKTGRILYVAPIDYLGRGFIKEHFLKLKSLGINPQAIIFDIRKVSPNAARKAFPGVLTQHDYFHVIPPLAGLAFEERHG
jgi:hypothetical protein